MEARDRKVVTSKAERIALQPRRDLAAGKDPGSYPFVSRERSCFVVVAVFSFIQEGSGTNASLLYISGQKYIFLIFFHL